MEETDLRGKLCEGKNTSKRGKITNEERGRDGRGWREESVTVARREMRKLATRKE